MQVSCSHCGARYEFEASAIPADGYDAQCTSCNAVFFVAPEAPSESAQVSVSCSHCGAVYQFSAGDIPAAGYDAQCTQCQSIFFVSPHTVQADTAPAAAAFPADSAPMFAVEAAPDFPAANAAAFAVDPAPAYLDSGATHAFAVPSATMIDVPIPGEQDSVTAEVELTAEAVADDDVPQVEQEDFASMSEVMRSPYTAAQPGQAAVPDTRAARRGFAPQALDSGTMELEVVAEAEPDEVREARRDFDDVMAINAELGEPIGGSPTSTSEEENLLLAAGRRRRQGLMTAGVVVGLAICGGLFYGLAPPRLFDATLGRVLGKHAIAPGAVALFNEGRTAMLQDTEQGYTKAVKSFNQAVKLDDRYVDALAWGAMAHSLRGSDVQAQGQEMWDKYQKELALLRGLQIMQKSGLTGSAGRIDELKAKVRQYQEDSTNLSESGGKAISDGWAWVQRGRHEAALAPIIAEAAAICYTSEPDGRTKAERALARSLELRFGTDAPHDASKPPDLWVPYLQAKFLAADHATLDKAQAAFTQAIKMEPHFIRARFGLAQLWWRAGQKDESKRLVDEILAEVPEHSKTRQLLAALAAPVVVAAVAAEPAHDAAPKPGKNLKGKTKGKRKR